MDLYVKVPEIFLMWNSADARYTDISKSQRGRVLELMSNAPGRLAVLP